MIFNLLLTIFGTNYIGQDENLSDQNAGTTAGINEGCA